MREEFEEIVKGRQAPNISALGDLAMLTVELALAISGMVQVFRGNDQAAILAFVIACYLHLQRGK